MVVPARVDVFQLRHDLVGKQLGVVSRQVLAHVAVLKQQHQVPDIELRGDFAELLGHLVGGAYDDIALLNDRLHVTGDRGEAFAGRFAADGGVGRLLDLAFDAGALAALAGIARRRGPFRIDVEAAAVKIFRGLRVEVIGMLAGLANADKLQESA